MIEIKDVVRYFGDFKVIDHLDLTIKDNEFFGLLGPNGAGKSTTIKMLCTLIQPTEGQILINGLDTKKHTKEIRKMIGVVFENEALYEELSAWDNLEIFARFQGVPSITLEKHIKDTLEIVELNKRAYDAVKNYSKGMKQRLLIARAIIHRPRIIFLDEPTVGLDPYAAELMRNLILSIQHECQSTVIMTTHYMEEATKLANRIGIMDKGMLQCVGTPDELKAKFVPYHKFEVQTGEGQLLKEIIPKNELWKVREDSVHTVIQVSAEVSNPLQSLLKLISDNHLQIKAVKEMEPSLEDVFLNVTGGQER